MLHDDGKPAVNFEALIEQVRAHSGIAHKRDIQCLQSLLPTQPAPEHPNGDDCAVLPAADGYNLLAIEGFINAFVEQDPWFAGWCGVMVNVSDIAAMGGYPLAVVDALWGEGDAKAAEVMRGMAAAASAFNVPIVGGHTNLRSAQEQLAVAIMGRANALLSSFAAQPGHALVAAIDLRGAYRAPFLNWNAATTAPPERLRGDIAVLPQVAERGLAMAAKDISQAGLLGTAVMLLECSDVGAEIDLLAIPHPDDVPWRDWLCSFPSFGYLLTTPLEQVDALLDSFHRRDIAVAQIGRITDSRQLWVHDGHAEHERQHSALFWDLADSALTGMAAVAASPADNTAYTGHDVVMNEEQIDA